MNSLYEAHLISTIVDKIFAHADFYLYEAHLISTIVDKCSNNKFEELYEAHLISTIVDSVYSVDSSLNSMRLI